jgi:exodeoxyribonuclease VII large subunit
MNDKKIFQVSEFNEFIDLYLNQAGEVVVEGEISQIKVSQNKWLFITIKDELSAVEIFGITYKISGFDLLEEGMLVHVSGTPRLYKKTGRFSIFAEQIVPAGEGALKLAFEKLRLKLDKEGLFAPERKRRIPVYPEKIGLITAKDSRAYSDFIKVLKDRMGGLKIYFYPVNVQGTDSVESIVEAFEYLNKTNPNLDLLVLARGGGSAEDLQPFNDERIARAIFSSKIPVVCGIGHEEDVSIADLVADLRASTPSNAAELIVRDRTEATKDVNNKVKAISSYLQQLLDEQNHILLNDINTLKGAIDREVINLHRVIERFNGKFIVFSKDIISYVEKTITIERQLVTVAGFWIKQKQTSLDSITRLLESFDFQSVLRRGFSITTNQSGTIIKSAKAIKIGDAITTSLFDGKIESEVKLTNK